jgi:hypothetical protein
MWHNIFVLQSPAALKTERKGEDNCTTNERSVTSSAQEDRKIRLRIRKMR